jgi:hypothetical protein
MAHYAPAQAQLRHEERNNEAFQKFTKECLSDPMVNRQTLKDFLILPVQRAARYHLLLRGNDLTRLVHFHIVIFN